jgi:diguanylate cyclase (GGDEF)-like protein
MIIAVSKCIKDAFSDVAECFRMGGDEFLVAMTAETELVQERLAMFDRLVSQWHGRYVDSITVSYGVATANEHPGLNFEELLRSADYMMYQRKNRKPGENNL